MTTRTILTLSLAVAASAAAQGTAPAQPLTLDTPTGTLHGTLQLPPGPGKPPVALIIAGSGPTDRDGNTTVLPGRNDSLRFLAQELAGHGVASLRYDKRGIGQSQTGQAEANLTLDDLANDATRWIRRLQQDPRFSSVSVIGHSEGALIGLLAARQVKPAAFVSIAGPGENIGDAILRQLRANPHNPPALVEESERILSELRAGRRVEQVSPLLAPLFRPSVQPYLISALKYDPASQLAGLNVPTLIVQGDRDLQVTPRDAQNLKAARPDARLLILPGVNHVLKQVGDDAALNQRSYTDPSLPLAPGLAEGVAGFLRDPGAR